jgi:hypothetical protein
MMHIFDDCIYVGGYESALDAHPVATKTAINVVIYLIGDWMVSRETSTY